MNTRPTMVPIRGFQLLLTLWMTTAVTLSAQTPGASGPKTDNTSFRELRLRTLLNSGWLSRRQTSPGAAAEPEFVGAERPDYDDSSWEMVHHPHSWDAMPDNPFTTTDHFHGLGWYRRKLEIPADWRGRRVWLEFNGVFQIADVWVNGRHLGQHIGGYTRFQFDVTDALHWNDTNLLAVRVNDVLSTFIAPTNETKCREL